MTSSIVLHAIMAIGAVLLLVAIFMFGRAVFDTITAIFRLVFSGIAAALRLVANAIVALGWYITSALLIIAIGGSAAIYYFWVKPSGFDITRIRPPVCTELLDRSGAVLDYLCPFDGVRVWRSIESLSVNLRVLVVMLEDDKFYEHSGLDIDEIWNALETDFEKKKLARGGSTITQQLAKNLFLTKEKSLIRKASEVPLAMRLEDRLTKDEILELYLNTIEWGPGIYGVEAASRLYFDHEASSLTDQEAWLLALMIPNPKQLNLWLAPKARRSLLLRARHLATRLYQEHRMSKSEAMAGLERFTAFVENWSKTRPLALRTGRKYPARWGHEKSFSLAEIVSIRRGAAGILKRYKHVPLRLNIDRALQEKLETIQATVHAHDLSDVVALMDGSAIRAMIPVNQSAIIKQIEPIAEASGLKTQVFRARNIPPQALWP